jgi:hypothetical protein
MLPPMDGRGRRAWAARACVAVASVALAAGCITIEGESSSTRLDRLRGSYLFVASQRFYPKGLPEDAAAVYPELGKKQVGEIQAELNAFVSALSGLHEREQAEISKALGARIQDPSMTHVRVVDTRKPFARIETDHRVTVDVVVAQALFRAALLGALTDPKSSPFDEDAFADATDEREVFEKFFDLRDRIAKLEGRTMIGDMFAIFSEDDMEDAPWFESVELEEAVQPLQRRYAGATMFFLSHEMGHAAFGHLSASAAQSEQEFQRREFEADAYAIVLLSRLLPNMGIFNDSFFGGNDWLGYEIFLESAYRLAGFSDSAGVGDFRYPEPEERERVARLMLEQTRAATPDVFQVMLEQLEAAQHGEADGE